MSVTPADMASVDLSPRGVALRSIDFPPNTFRKTSLMKLRHIVPVLGLAALLTVGCAQSTLSADRDADLAEIEATEVSECSAAKSCCPSEKAALSECTEEQKAECAEKKECPMTGDVEG